MEIVLDSEFRNGFVEVRRINSRLILVKIVWRGLLFNLVNTYGPKVGLDEAAKRKFWKGFDTLLFGINRQAKERLIFGRP